MCPCTGVGRAVRIQRDLLIYRIRILLLIDDPVIQHILKDQIPALYRLVRMSQRIIDTWIVGNCA